MTRIEEVYSCAPIHFGHSYTIKTRKTGKHKNPHRDSRWGQKRKVYYMVLCNGASSGRKSTSSNRGPSLLSPLCSMKSIMKCPQVGHILWWFACGWNGLKSAKCNRFLSKQAMSLLSNSTTHLHRRHCACLPTKAGVMILMKVLSR